ncbi:hypothetical protein IFM47457_03340 [Aspergillus lentulus]|uniref:Uncharacterized protein n=1 Tax=Aspergillus lentulus TaxID=293939 RepID=A0ABQ1AMD6_ASPLE|nr:hypothetical protein IFM62136_02649 [Aspergillus lentulus]GFF73228.1 hypothetical protein IFM47457_03340 [Aspergillus lentulus]GFF84581.1 hypothetical protein IFM60648_07076 [Aspergillus lentulus]
MAQLCAGAGTLWYFCKSVTQSVVPPRPQHVADPFRVIIDKNVTVAAGVDKVLGDSARLVQDLGNLGVSNVPSCTGAHSLRDVNSKSIISRPTDAAKYTLPPLIAQGAAFAQILV